MAINVSHMSGKHFRIAYFSIHVQQIYKILRFLIGMSLIIDYLLRKAATENNFDSSQLAKMKKYILYMSLS